MYSVSHLQCLTSHRHPVATTCHAGDTVWCCSFVLSFVRSVLLSCFAYTSCCGLNTSVPPVPIATIVAIRMYFSILYMYIKRLILSHRHFLVLRQPCSISQISSWRFGSWSWTLSTSDFRRVAPCTTDSISTVKGSISEYYYRVFTHCCRYIYTSRRLVCGLDSFADAIPNLNKVILCARIVQGRRHSLPALHPSNLVCHTFIYI